MENKEINQYQYNLRERMQIYGKSTIGALMGIGIPIAATRYTIFGDMNEGFGQSIIAWAGSTICTIPITPFSGIAGFAGGVMAGKLSADELVKKRLGLEEKIE